MIPPFDPDFAAPADYAALYRGMGLQLVPAWMPSEHKSWKRPHIKAWTGYQRERTGEALWGHWYGPQGIYATRPNMGLITGRVSGNVGVLDLDIHKHRGALAWWRGFLAAYNNRLELETVEQRTGGGGLQKLFRYPDGYRIPTFRTDVGVDSRGEGGFAMLAPSLHESGERYDWLPGCAPWEVEIAQAPDWLMAALDGLAKAGAGQSGNSGGNGPFRPAVNEGETGGDAFAHMRRNAPENAAYASATDGFGHATDGREEVMRDAVWHGVLEWYRECPIMPPESEWQARCAEAYEGYERRVTTRIPGVSLREGLQQEFRGLSAFTGKWLAAMRKWGTPEFMAEADKPPPAEDPGPRASEPPLSGDETSPPNPIPLVSAFPIDEASLPVRDWTVPGLLLKRSLTVLVAPPGSGKSLFTLQLAIAIALGMTWAGWTPRRAEKVLIVNIEDDIDEMRRRLAAAARTMGVDQAALTGRIMLVDNPESVVIARTDSRSKTVIRTPLVEKLIATIVEQDIGVVVADPFAETFEGDENSNSEVKWAGILWREVARRAACCLLLVHHTKKYAGSMAGEADASRGGGALIGTARILSTLFMMTEDEASVMNVPVEDRMNYVRFDDAKANFAKLNSARWFEKQTVTLNNATGFAPGDEVGVLVPWKPPGALDGISMHDIGRVLDTIDRGIMNDIGAPTGQFYSASGTDAPSSRWVGKVLMEQTGCSDAAARRVIKDWLKNEVLEVFEHLDPMQRRLRKAVRSVLKNRPNAAPQYESM